MIHEVEGDILLSHAKVIAHGVAPNDHFNRGLALALRERWPAMAKDFRHYFRTDHPDPGTIWAWMGADGREIVNLLISDGEDTQREMSAGPAHLWCVHRALQELRRFIEKEQPASVALPKIGTGAGQLDWRQIYPLVQQALGDLPTTIYLYVTYHPGVAADEPPPAVSGRPEQAVHGEAGTNQ